MAGRARAGDCAWRAEREAYSEVVLRQRLRDALAQLARLDEALAARIGE